MSTFTNKDVYDIIDYLCKNGVNQKHEIDEELYVMTHLMSDIGDDWFRHQHSFVLSKIRRIVTAGLRCFENHGVPSHINISSWKPGPITRDDVYEIVDADPGLNNFNNKNASIALTIMKMEYCLSRARSHIVTDGVVVYALGWNSMFGK
jgi:hypothetical protein